MKRIAVGATALRAALVTLCLAAGLAACGASQSPVYDNTYQYLNALAEGDFSSACGLLDTQARSELARSAGRHVSCARAFVVCLPDRALVATQDQSQLFYATVVISEHGSTASARLSGTAVADALKRLTLTEVSSGQWELSSYGEGLTGCAQRRHRRSHGERKHH